MEMSPKQQFAKLLDASNRILILPSDLVDGDCLGAALGLHLAFKKLGKEPTTVVFNPVPEVYQFLPGLSFIESSLDAAKDFIITVNCANAEVEKVKYKIEDQKVNIIITPKSGHLTADDLSFQEGGKKYDLMITLDGSDLTMFQKPRDAAPDMFFDTPLVNIDHHVTNEHFGKINIVDVAATSTCEIVLSVLETISPQKPLMDPDIATCLLNGVISDTGSFQNSNTTPKAFSVAAQLLAAGARQQEIIKHVYKTRKLSTLKLWGKVLSKTQYDPVHRLVWSSVSKQDLIDSNASEEEIGSIIDELMVGAPNTDTVILFKESNGVIRASMRSTTNEVDVARLAGLFGGGGHKRASGFKIEGKPLPEAEKFALEKIRAELAKHYGTVPAVPKLTGVPAQ